MRDITKKLVLVRKIAGILHEQLGVETFFVGGFVRDTLLGVESHDIDLATGARPKQIIKVLHEKSCCSIVLKEKVTFTVLPLGIEYGVVSVVCKTPTITEVFEIASFRKDMACDGRHAVIKYAKTIQEDLARRDLTINAMAMNVTDNCFVDPFGGKKDLEKKIIRTVGNPTERFNEDYLRMIRAVRFVGTIGGYLDKDTGIAIQANCGKLSLISKERIRDELLKMLVLDNVKNCILLMDQLGLLARVIPPLTQCIDVGGGCHHSESVFEHCVDAGCFLPADNPLLRLAGLLHDIGKPTTKEGSGEECSFIQHETVGAKLAEKYLREFKFSSYEVEYVCNIVKNHMFHFELDTKKKAIKKWLVRVGGNWRDLIQLRMADRAANRAKVGKPLVTNFMEDLIEKVSEIENYEEPLRITDLEISGNDLIEKFNLTPGPIFSILLGECLDIVLEDPEKNVKETLIDIVKEKLNAKSKN